MSFQDELEAALAGEDPEWDSPPTATPSTDQANQWLARVAQINRQEDEIQEAFDAAVNRMRVATNARLTDLHRQRGWFTEALEVYHDTQLRLDPEGSKTIPLPCGTLVSRMGQATWDVENEDSLMEWCRQDLPSAIKVPVPAEDRLDKAALKRELKGSRVSDGRVMLGDGTVVPGLFVHPAQRNFTLKFD